MFRLLTAGWFESSTPPPPKNSSACKGRFFSNASNNFGIIYFSHARKTRLMEKFIYISKKIFGVNFLRDVGSQGPATVQLK